VPDCLHRDLGQPPLSFGEQDPGGRFLPWTRTATLNQGHKVVDACVQKRALVV
jgi:hypothetical protein